MSSERRESSSEPQKHLPEQQELSSDPQELLSVPRELSSDPKELSSESTGLPYRRTELSYGSLAEILRFFKFEKRYNLVQKTLELRKSENSMPYFFKNVTFKTVRLGGTEQRSMEIDEKTWTATKIDDEHMILESPNGAKENVKGVMYHVFDGFIEYFFKRKGTFIKRLYLDTFCPLIPLHLITVATLSIRTSREDLHPLFVPILRSAAVQVKKMIVYNIFPTTTFFDHLSGLQLENLEIRLVNQADHRAILNIHAKTFNTIEYVSGVPSKSRVMDYVKNLIKYPTEMGSNYEMHFPAPPAYKMLEDEQFVKEILEMKGRVVVEKKHLVIEVSDSLEIAIRSIFNETKLDVMLYMTESAKRKLSQPIEKPRLRHFFVRPDTHALS